MNDPVRYSAAVLDANVGSTNVTEQQKIDEIVFDTFQTITDLLKNHCGPYSTFAITHSVGDTVTEPTFTNDGINIVKRLSFLNPIQDFARRNIAYIGSRIETRVGDGTTTAMILASSFMKHMTDPRNKDLRELLTRIPFSTLAQTYEELRMKLVMLENSDVRRIDYNDKCKLRKIAYAQAYTSSHGDVELSTAIAHLFSKLPREAWSYIYYYREGMETKTRYKVREETDQFTSTVTIMNKNMFNDKLGTSYLSADVKTLVFPDNLTVSDTITWNALEAAIKESIISELPLVVLCADNIDGYTRKTINDLLVDDIKHNVAIFFHHREHPVLNDFRILTLLSRQVDLQPKVFELKAVDVSCSGHDFAINKIFTEEEKEEEEVKPDGYTALKTFLYKNEDGSVHPFIHDSEYPQYKQQVDELRSLIDQAKEEAAYRDINSEVQSYIRIYNRLYFRKKYMIVVGGLAYDNSAAMDVLLDTVNAVNQTLKEGYTAGANSVFCSHLLHLKDQYKKQSKAKSEKDILHQKLMYHFVESLLCALEDLYSGIQSNSDYSNKEKSPITLIKEKQKSITNDYSHPIFALTYDCNDGWSLYDLDFKITCTEIGSDVDAVMQPASLIPEVLLRIGEVCLKFLKTSSIITENGVYTPPKKKKKFLFF